MTANTAPRTRTAPYLAALWWLLVAAALALTLRGNRQMAGLGYPTAGLPWWLGALGLLALAAWISDRSAAARPKTPWRSADRLMLISVLAVALLTRLWGIGEYPPSDAFAFEEFQTGSVAYRVFLGGSFPWEFPLTNIAPAATFALIGLDAWGLRAPFLVSGVVAPVFFFIAMRRVVSLPAAGAAAALLAGARWPAAAARFADEIFFPIWVVALALWLLVRSVQSGRRLDLLLCALVAGDLFYAYTAYRAFPLIVFAAAVVAFVIRRRHLWVPTLQHLALMAMVWFVMLSPGALSGSGVFGEGFRRHAAGWALASAEDRSIQGRFPQVWQMLRAGVAVFVSEGDLTASANIPGEPMLDAGTAALCFLAIAFAVWRWRQPWRAGLLATVVLPFLGLAIFPINLYVGRFFVLLVPLFALIAFLFDDILRWRHAPRWTAAALGIGTVGLVALNLYDLQRLIDHPKVRASFLVPENTVIAAVHEAPRGARVVMLTLDSSNALEPSDYTWYCSYQTGGRPGSVREALVVNPAEAAPIRWVIQGEPEAQLLPELVALACPGGERKVRSVPENPLATVATVDVANGHKCTTPPPVGLTATYTVDLESGPRLLATTDPVLMQHTIPPDIAWQVEARQALRLKIEWSGTLVPTVPPHHEIELHLLNATGRLVVAEAHADISTVSEHRWGAAALPLPTGSEAIPIRVELYGQPGLRPAVRLFWRLAGTEPRLIPPQALLPAR